MKIVKSLPEWQTIRAELGSLNIGFVPTMGALHAGHRSLVERSAAETEITVASIFVNPTQFNDTSDFDKYPKTWDADVKLLEAAGCNYLIAPEFSEIYADQYRYSVDEKELSRVLCGAHRPGHFQGVLSVVMKLLNLVRPSSAYFGEKDFQQLKLIEGMVTAFFMQTRIVPCPTVRDPDGLAMSSRNTRLNPEDREKAPLFYRVLTSNASLLEMWKKLEKEGFEVDYLEEMHGRRFGAVKLGGVRLIDNVTVNSGVSVHV
jgi:pantoate--beta-alanine ligase